MIGQSISRNSLLLALFAIVTTGGIAGTYLGTKERIAEQQRQAEEQALVEIFPRSSHDNSMLDDAIPVSDTKYLKLDDEKNIYVAKQGGEPVGFIIPAVAPEGYTDKLFLIVGINVDGTIAGVRVLKHRETPGLGDNVDLAKSNWVLGFNGKSLTNPTPENWKVKKDKGYFDQFTGATITPRAVTKAVFNTLNFFQAHRRELINPAAPAADDATDEQQNAATAAAEASHHG